MLTTYDLYKKPEYNFRVNDLVSFKLLKEYRLSIYWAGHDGSKRGIIKKSKSKYLDKTITGTIVSYEPGKLRDLEIELMRNDGCPIKLKLSQCEDIEVLS